MSCAVDPVAWGEKNRVELATGKVQRWLLARTTRDQPTLATIADTTRAVFSRWFPHSTPLDPLFADAGDAVDAITLHGIYDHEPALVANAQRREALDPVPMLAPGPNPPIYVEVSFNYRGWAKSMPWPVWTQDNASLLRSSKICPLDCDWMLVAAYPVGALVDAPDELGALDKLAQNGPGGLGDLAAGLGALTTLVKVGLALYLGAQALNLATHLPSVKRKGSK